MEEVVSSIKRVTDIMGEISAASSEQSQGVAQIGVAVNELDRMTQQNAALVEQTAAAAGLKLCALGLLPYANVRALDAFKLVEDEELREAMSERGLGTPATRAAIIEKAIATAPNIGLWSAAPPGSHAMMKW